MIRLVVAEELKVMLPLMLSEMFVRNIVAEHVSERAPATIAPKKRTKLAEQLNFDEEDREEARPTQASRQQRREKIRRSVLEDPDENPLASIYEGTVPLGEEDALTSEFGSDGVPLDMIPGMTADFSKFLPDAAEVSARGPIRETPEMAMRRLERERARLDSMKVG